MFNEVELKAAVEILYNPRIFKEHKRSGKIDSDSINPLLFGYRYCLNILYSKTRDGLYYQLYIRNNVNYISENFSQVMILNIIQYIQILKIILKVNKMKAVMFAYVEIGIIILFLQGFLKEMN